MINNLLQKPNYKAWNWNYTEFPDKSNIREQLKFILKAGILAPSIHNTQPWKFKILEELVIVIPDWNYQLKQSDPSGKNLFISLGCCLTNIECAATYFGFTTDVKYKTDLKNKLNIEILFKKNGKTQRELANLCPYINKRFSNKLPYLNKLVDIKYQKVINNLKLNNIHVKTSDDKKVIAKAALLQQNSIIEISRNKLFAKELAAWLKPNNTSDDDGMPGFVAGLKPLQASIGKVVLGNIPGALSLLAKKDKFLIETSPLVAVITAPDDDITTAIDVGRVYALLALTATSLGLSSTPMHSMIEDNKGSKALTSLLGLSKSIPAFFLRIGYSNIKEYHTPRRELYKSLDNMDHEVELAQSISKDLKIDQVKIGKYTINYAALGEGQPLILLHGGNIGWGQWYPNILALAKYFKVYAIDLVGGGRSSKIEFKDMDFSKDLLDVTDQFIQTLNLKKPIIIGSSMGGWIAVNLALRRPQEISKLVLADSIGFTDYIRFPDRIIGFYTIAKFLSKTVLKPVRSNKNIENFMRSVFGNSQVNLSPEFIEYFYETMAQSHNLLFISRMSSPFGVRPEIKLKSKLRNLKTSTLVIWGEKDQLTPIEKNKDSIMLIPHVDLKVIKGAGHIPSIEKPDDFNQLVLEFLRR